MDEYTIKALLTLEVRKNNDNTQIVTIPYEDVLRGKISIRLNDTNSTTHTILSTTSELTTLTKENKEQSLFIIEPIQKLYTDKDKMTQDVIDYLKIVANCWEYKKVGLKTSLLKKVASRQPSLNSIIFKVYGKEGDPYLSQLIQDNMFYIQQCWEELPN